MKHKIQKKICILIPCYNEERGIANVIKALPVKKLSAMGFLTEILVINNNSTDRTASVARKAGATVISEKKQGKGYALIRGFKSLGPDVDIVVMIDGDDTYSLKEIVRLIEPLDSDFCDVVVGSRLSGRIVHGAMNEFNRIGNWLFTFLVRTAYHGNVTDVCSGYFAWKRSVIDGLTPHLKSNGFSIEMEMIAKMSRMDYDIMSVPITYTAREGRSSLNPLKDGKEILHTWFTHLTWSDKPKPLLKKVPFLKKIFYPDI